MALLLRLQGDIIRADEVQAVSLYDDRPDSENFVLEVWLRHREDPLEFDYTNEAEAKRDMERCAMFMN